MLLEMPWKSEIFSPLGALDLSKENWLSYWVPEVAATQTSHDQGLQSQFTTPKFALPKAVDLI